jgi:hypothetical protein
VSRGLGRVQRDVLAFLEKEARRSPDWPVRLDVITQVTGHHPESVRRAMKSLKRVGHIELGRDSGLRVDEYGDLYRFWDGPAPTGRLSAAYLSTLSNGTDREGT